MADPSNIDYLKPYIEATITSSTRFRRVLIVLIVASVLAFGAFWNARNDSWINSRLAGVQKADAYLSIKESEEKLSSANSDLREAQTKLNQPNITEEEKKQQLAAQERLVKDIGQLTRQKEQLIKNFNEDDRKDVEQWLKQRNITSRERLAPIIERLETSRLDNVILIRVPFFGIVVDVNDLGLLGGFTFVVILMWFRFSLWREYYNLRSTFRQAQTDKDLESCYKVLAMNQVLTVPPALTRYQPSERPWGKVVRFLYFLPVIVLVAILVNDARTFERGWVVNRFSAVFGIALGLSFLAICILLTYWCYRLSSEIDDEWETAAKRIRETLDRE